MPKKSKAKAKGKIRKEIDWAAEAFFDKKRAMIYIEHTNECPIFQIKAEEFCHFLQEQIPDQMFQLVRNQNGKLQPRNGAFEIGFAQNARTSVHDLWTGLDKGPPRRDKFPNYETLLPEVRKVLKKFYVDLLKKPEDEDADEGDNDVLPRPTSTMHMIHEGADTEDSV